MGYGQLDLCPQPDPGRNVSAKYWLGNQDRTQLGTNGFSRMFRAEWEWELILQGSWVLRGAEEEFRQPRCPRGL